MKKTKKLYHTNPRYTAYSPSILMITDNPARLLKLKRQLEDNGCQVCLTDPSSDSLATARQKYFDLIVLDAEQPGENAFEVYQKLKGYPELVKIPAVILTTCNRAKEAISSLKMGWVYFLTAPHTDAQESSIGIGLLNFIEQIHYLTYRYT